MEQKVYAFQQNKDAMFEEALRQTALQWRLTNQFIE
jgi:hypothetical protein